MLPVSIALIVAGVLFLPATLASMIQGPIEAIKASGIQASYKECPVLTHIGWIDTGKNAMIVALCFAAATTFDLESAKR